MNSTVQMNTRIDPSLKASGDAALALIGLNPSQAVRALWTKAARRGKDLEEVAQLLSTDASDAGEHAAEDAIIKGWRFMDEAYASLGIDVDAVPGYESDDELLEEALFESLEYRGLA